MTTQESTTRGGGLATTLNLLIGLMALIAIGAILWMTVKDVPLPSILTLPTAAVARPAPRAPAAQPASVPAAIDAYNATAEAQWKDAQPVQNVGQGAPVVTGQRVNERDAAPAIVPTAEPVGESNELFGSKPMPVNPQADHQCRHAQVWTDGGCKNPTPEAK